jgi:ribonuclease P protein component
MATFPKSARLRRTPEFRNTFDQGQKMVCGPLVLYAAIRTPNVLNPPSGSPDPAGFRLGLVVSRKVGNAVVRNRVKRGLREAFRNLRLAVEGFEPWSHVDLIVLARPSAAATDGKDLARCLKSCVDKLRKSLSVRQDWEKLLHKEPTS